MNKMELVSALAEKTGTTKRASEESLRAFQEIVQKELSKGGKIQLVGFGTFETSKRKARTGVNPKTRQKITIPATIVPRFKAGKALKDGVNKRK